VAETAALSALAAPVLVAVAAVSCALLLGLVRDVVRLRRIKRRAQPLGLLAVRGALLGSSPKVATPTAIGYLHPAIVIPDGFGSRVDGTEWAAVVAHECAHLSRRDDWAKALQSAVLRAGWWLPGLWILSRALDLERELVSDERAATAGGARRYAACLLRLATDRWTDAVAPGLWNRRSHVAIRVERLLRPPAAAAPVLRATIFGSATAAAFAVVATAILAVPGSARPVARAAPGLAHAVRHAARHSPRLAVRLHHPVPSAAPRVVGWVVNAPAAAPPAPAAAPAAAAPPAARPAVSVSPRRVAASHDRTPVRREPPRRDTLAEAPPTAIAFVTRSPRCPTCFGPLRSADAPVASPSPAFGGPAVPATIAPPDPTSGPVDLGSGMVWYRLPSRAVAIP
jgi:hypothetical protein